MPGSMEVIDLSTRSDGLPEFDLSRLRPEERELWERYFTGPLEDGESEAIRIWSFGYACMLELWGPPDVVSEWLNEVDPENKIGQYLENVRRARERGE
jgi:hypothetical protein